METEFEAKFYPVDKKEIRRRLKKLRARLIHPERLMRRVIFSAEDNPRIKGTYLRVRDEGYRVTLSIKVHASEGGKLTDQKEIGMTVSDFDQAIEVMELAGLKKSAYHENKRETWDYQGAQVEIDSWPDLESYVEIEAQSEDKVKKMAEKLGFSWEKKIITGVLQIYMKRYNLNWKTAWERIKDLKFSDRPFSKGKNA